MSKTYHFLRLFCFLFLALQYSSRCASWVFLGSEQAIFVFLSLFLPISKHEMGTQTLYNLRFINIIVIVNTVLVNFLKTRLFRCNCLFWLGGWGSPLTFFLQNQRGNDFCDVCLENNVKCVSHEFEWKSLYRDKIVLRRIHSVAVNAFSMLRSQWESTAMKLSEELVAMVSTLLI